MYSKVKFDIDEDNNPCIVAEIAPSSIPSDDVRDKIARRFKESFGHESNICYVEYDDNKMTIKPLSAESLNAFKKEEETVYNPHHTLWRG